MDHALALPWDRYENYDMVVWGVRERVEEGEMEGAHNADLAAQPCESWEALPGMTAGCATVATSHKIRGTARMACELCKASTNDG